MLPPIIAHHEGAIDPDLLDAIIHLLESLFGVQGWPAVVVLGAIILVIPVSLIVGYIWYRRRVGS